MRMVDIKEEVKLPGTNIVLEKGDRIRVLNASIEEAFYRPTLINDLKDIFLNQMIMPNQTDLEGAGKDFIVELDSAIGDQVTDEMMIEFYQGMKKALATMV